MISQPNWISTTYFTISSKRMKDLCSTYRAHFWGQISNSIVQVYQMFFFQSKLLQKIWQFSFLTICLSFWSQDLCQFTKVHSMYCQWVQKKKWLPNHKRSKYKHNFGFPVYGSLHKCEFALCVTQWDKWSRSFWLLLFWPLRSFKNSLVCNF